MAPYTDTPTDLGTIAAEYNTRRAVYQVFTDYDEGRHELRFATKSFQDNYGGTLKSLRENLCPAAISSIADGLALKSWGDTQAEGVADEEGLTRLADLVHTEAPRAGDAFVLVWPGTDGQPVPHFHRAHEFVPHVSDTDPGMMEWAAKIWVDGQRRPRMTIYFADRCERYAAKPGPKDGTTAIPETHDSWVAFDGDGDGHTITHTFGKVPVVWFKYNAQSQHDHGRSILTDVIPLQDAQNTSLAHVVVTGEAYAKPFWYLLNFKPKDPTNPLAVGAEYQAALAGLQTMTEAAAPMNTGRAQKFDRTKQSVFTHDGPGPFGQLDPPDLTKLIAVQDAFALKIARVIGAPSYWFTQTSGNVPSGESLRVLGQRRTAAIRKFQRAATPCWRGVCELLGMSDPKPVWEDPNQPDEAERVEIAVKKRTELGYALPDAIAGIGESDVAGIAERALAEARATAAAAGKAFRDGTIDAAYADQP